MHNAHRIVRMLSSVFHAELGHCMACFVTQATRIAFEIESVTWCQEALQSRRRQLLRVWARETST